LTDARPIKPTSTRCLSARRPNPGRGSTYRRGNPVQTTAATSINRRKKAAEVVQFPPKLNEQEPLRKQQVLDQALERINEQRREQGLPSLEMARQIRKGMEVAPAPQGKVLSNHDPIKLFEDEIAKEMGDD
jgi:hypothetical protein